MFQECREGTVLTHSHFCFLCGWDHQVLLSRTGDRIPDLGNCQLLKMELLQFFARVGMGRKEASPTIPYEVLVYLLCPVHSLSLQGFLCQH